MNITKYGHCCLLIDINGVRILTDPGNYSTMQDTAENVDFILITHEHSDHLHIDSVKTILKKGCLPKNASPNRQRKNGKNYVKQLCEFTFRIWLLWASLDYIK
ncbi:MAG: MBL fold metallo-hydrolase [Nanoarchaeota archaeon]|mgnify:CR=1 FL=1